MSKLELAIIAGAESKDFLASLSATVDKLEKLVNAASKLKVNVKTKANDDDEEDEDEAEEQETKPAKGRAVRAKSDADDEDSEDDEDDDSDDEAETDDADEDEEEKPTKAAKGKKKKGPTLDDVNDACRAAAKRTSRKEVLRILKKSFKVKSVTDLEEDQYQDVIDEMEIDA